jgi:hypothetical protein
MSGLADQQSETDDPQIASFAFGVSAPVSLPENPSMARTGVIQSCQLT